MNMQSMLEQLLESARKKSMPNILMKIEHQKYEIAQRLCNHDDKKEIYVNLLYHITIQQSNIYAAVLRMLDNDDEKETFSLIQKSFESSMEFMKEMAEKIKKGKS